MFWIAIERFRARNPRPSVGDRPDGVCPRRHFTITADNTAACANPAFDHPNPPPEAPSADPAPPLRVPSRQPAPVVLSARVPVPPAPLASSRARSSAPRAAPAVPATPIAASPAMATVAATTALTAPAAGASPTPPFSAKIRQRYPNAFAKPSRASPAPPSRRARLPARRSDPNASLRVESGERVRTRGRHRRPRPPLFFFLPRLTDGFLTLSLDQQPRGPPPRWRRQGRLGQARRRGQGSPGVQRRRRRRPRARARGARQRGDHRRL